MKYNSALCCDCQYTGAAARGAALPAALPGVTDLVFTRGRKLCVAVVQQAARRREVVEQMICHAGSSSSTR